MDFGVSGGGIDGHETIDHRELDGFAVDFQRIVLGPLRNADGHLLVQAIRVGHVEGDVAAPRVFVTGLGLLDGEAIFEFGLVGHELVGVHRLAVIRNRVQVLVEGCD